jgi:16S rRNA (guanine527-N7)-methyltransferase
MDRSSYIDTFSRFYQVSRETITGLEKFENLLINANKSLNLIANSTIDKIWHRHIMDSFQVIDFISKNDKIIVDIGSGAGFPGIVIAFAANERKIPLKIVLFEKSIKKAKFLENTISNLNLNIQVICKNILDEEEIVGDVFVARAFKPLPVILELIHNKKLNFKKFIIFLGKTGGSELIQASKSWNIDYKQRVSVTSNDSKILEINNLIKKKNV